MRGLQAITVRQKIWLAALVFGGAATALLWQEHRTHILGFLPYALLAACPLMHILMHGNHAGHGGHAHGGHADADNRKFTGKAGDESGKPGRRA